MPERTLHPVTDPKVPRVPPPSPCGRDNGAILPQTPQIWVWLPKKHPSPPRSFRAVGPKGWELVGPKPQGGGINTCRAGNPFPPFFFLSLA